MLLIVRNTRPDTNAPVTYKNRLPVAFIKDSVAVARSSLLQQNIRICRRLCVLVNAGQHLFCFYERWMVILLFFRGRSVVTVISEGVPILWAPSK